MIPILITPQAQSDLESIYAYTAAEWGLDQADRYQDELFRGFQLIAENPAIGSQYPYAKYDYRVLHVNRHLIFYRDAIDQCLITRVLHEKMNLKAYL